MGSQVVACGYEITPGMWFSKPSTIRRIAQKSQHRTISIGLRFGCWILNSFLLTLAPKERYDTW